MTALLVAGLGFLVSRGISRPVAALSSVASSVSQGNLTVLVPNFHRNDEIGVLADAFRTMVGDLRDQIGQVLTGVNVLSSSSAEIAAIVSQVSSSAAQTSSAVTETSTTVEQVKQAARLASEKARTVVDTAQQAVQISQLGKKATDETVQRINLIREQMESIGETVVRLSEHSRAIETIIETVQDLADQSNLLAVNASIEAARAGDQGKGFAVVAQEIKLLADQSRQATEQVRGILGETRKWVSAVVMAAEQGSKAVDIGVEQSTAAGRAIESLSGSVSASAQAATVIEASSEQQFTGVDQVYGAMTSIQQAIRQNSEGTAQLQESAQRLADLGEQLKEVVGKYQV